MVFGGFLMSYSSVGLISLKKTFTPEKKHCFFFYHQREERKRFSRKALKFSRYPGDSFCLINN